MRGRLLVASLVLAGRDRARSARSRRRARGRAPSRNSASASAQRMIRKYAIPSASRIDAFSGSSRFAFSSGDGRLRGHPVRRCCGPAGRGRMRRSPPHLADGVKRGRSDRSESALRSRVAVRSRERAKPSTRNSSSACAPGRRLGPVGGPVPRLGERRAERPARTSRAPAPQSAGASRPSRSGRPRGRGRRGRRRAPPGRPRRAAVGRGGGAAVSRRRSFAPTTSPAAASGTTG